MVNLGRLLENVLYTFKEMHDNIENNTVSIENINSLTAFLIDYDSITTAELLQKYKNNKE